MIRRRIAKLAVSALVLGGAMTAGPLIAGGGVAGASSGTHRLTGVVSDGTTYQGPHLRFNFSCSSNTGIYTLRVSNINVVDAAGNSFISGGNTNLTLLYDVYNFGSSQVTVPLTQTVKNGLWQVRFAGVIPTGDCVSGQLVVLADIFLTQGPGHFNVSGTLS
jgi:hypothetical protein